MYNVHEHCAHSGTCTIVHLHVQVHVHAKL